MAVSMHGEGIAVKGQDCPLCQSPTFAIWRLRGSRTGRSTPLFRCPSCDSYFQRPGYSEDDSAWLGDFEWHLAQQESRRHEAQQLLDRLTVVMPEGRTLLDIGCGTGNLISEATERGLTASGVEPNPYAARHAQELGLEVVHSFFSAGALDRTFDFVVADMVLEHVDDPRGFLVEALSVVKQGGLLQVTVPGRTGGSLRIIASLLFPRSKWSLFLDNDSHINHFSRDGLVRVLTSLGCILRAEPATGQYIFEKGQVQYEW